MFVRRHIDFVFGVQLPAKMLAKQAKHSQHTLTNTPDRQLCAACIALVAEVGRLTIAPPAIGSGRQGHVLQAGL